MEKVKIVCRYLDGKIIKGYTQDFFPNKPSFHIFSRDTSNPKESVEVFLSELKPSSLSATSPEGRITMNENNMLPANALPEGSWK